MTIGHQLGHMIGAYFIDLKLVSHDVSENKNKISIQLQLSRELIGKKIKFTLPLRSVNSEWFSLWVIQYAQKVPTKFILKLKCFWRNQVVIDKVSSNCQKAFWCYKKEPFREKGWEEIGGWTLSLIKLRKKFINSLSSKMSEISKWKITCADTFNLSFHFHWSSVYFSFSCHISEENKTPKT